MQVRILLSLLVALFGVFLFGSGFFQVPLLSSSFHIPSPTTTSNNAPLHPYESTFSAAPHPTTSFRRVVFLLIDALRPDMINSQDMPQTYNLLQTADAWASTVASPGGLVQGTSSATLHEPPRCTFVASAATPTVTMPRIKALMSGINPSFVDVFRNFDDGVVLKRDNLIHRLHERGDRLVLLGDDTWLKLFPVEFDATLSDPTHSFFAQDTTEVDNNVTRHVSEFLDPQLKHPKSTAWDVLVMHYLGLDHVGHMRGPRSLLMKKKKKKWIK